MTNAELLSNACLRFVRDIEHGGDVCSNWRNYYDDPIIYSPPFHNQLFLHFDDITRAMRTEQHVRFYTTGQFCDRRRLTEVLRNIFVLFDGILTKENVVLNKEYVGRFFIDDRPVDFNEL